VSHCGVDRDDQIETLYERRGIGEIGEVCRNVDNRKSGIACVNVGGGSARLQ
jgi:hypothetical protein